MALRIMVAKATSPLTVELVRLGYTQLMTIPPYVRYTSTFLARRLHAPGG